MFLCPKKSNNSKKNHYLCKVLYFIVKSKGRTTHHIVPLS